METISQTEGNAYRYRFSVGTNNGVFNHVTGYGDTWEEAFQRADQKENQ